MGRCIYCGQRAGFLRRQHLDCFERHKRAVTTIPRFFGQAMESDIAAERFSELLQAAAQGSYVVADEFRSLCQAGMNGIIDRILKERPLVDKEIERLTQLSEALGKYFAGGLGLDERIIKLGIVSDVRAGKIPSCVSIVGPIPLTFDEGETVLWVFNYAEARRVGEDQAKALPDPARPNDDGYFRPDALGKAHAPEAGSAGRAVGDLVLTDRNIYFLQARAPALKIPVARVETLRAYAEGFHLSGKFSGKRPSLFTVNDAWLAANLLGRLLRPEGREAEYLTGLSNNPV